MGNLVGHRLEEMADLRSVRKFNVVKICSIVAIVILLFYGLSHLSNGLTFFAAANLISAIILTINLFFMFKRQTLRFADAILSLVLLFQASILLLFSTYGSGTQIWLYPLLAAVIFSNEFKAGVAYGFGFVGFTLFAVYNNLAASLGDISPDRFIVSLGALCLLCNTSSYYYDKAVGYIQSLYKEGIKDLAYFDRLTGLANRWSFESWANDKLEEERNANTITAMIFIDIDDFKAINDTFGHDVGDRVLQCFSNRLKNNVRNRDRKTEKNDYSIARFAGDEFVLLLYGVKSKSDLESILYRILHLFEDCYQGKEKVGKLAVSLGVALFPEDAATLPELTRCADKAMYSAKHSGKNQFHYYKKDRALASSTLHNVTSITHKQG